MKKIVLLTILMVPFFAFAQLSKKDKKAINKYADNMCSCMNEVMQALGPKANEFIMVMATEGEEAFEEQFLEFYKSASEEEAAAVIASFDRMSSEEFQNKTEACDDKGKLAPGLSAEIDTNIGDAYDYFNQYISEEEACTLLNYLLILGRSSEIEEAE